MADKLTGVIDNEDRKEAMGLLYALPIASAPVSWVPFERLVFNENYLPSFAAGYVATLAALAVVYGVLRWKFVGVDVVRFLIVPAFGMAGAAGNMLVVIENSDDMILAYVVTADMLLFVIGTMVAVCWAIVTRLR